MKNISEKKLHLKKRRKINEKINYFNTFSFGS